MKRKINSKSKTKRKVKGNVVIHNENKVIIHTPKPKRSYRRKKTTNTQANNYVQPNQPIITYFNPEPPRKETQNELLKMAENYISPPQIMNTQNQEEEKNIREIETKPTKSKQYKSITEQIYKKPSIKYVDVNDPNQLKKLGVKQLKELGKLNGVSNDILETLNSKSKDMIIDEHFKNKKSTTKNSDEESKSTPTIKVSGKPKKLNIDDELNNLISSIDTNTPTLAKAGGAVLASKQKQTKSDNQTKKEVGNVLNDMITKLETQPKTPSKRKASGKAKKTT